MASKQKKSGKGNAAAVSRQQQRQAEEKTLVREAEKTAENARKTRRLGNAYLLALLSLVALFCLYVTVKTLLFPAASLAELRDNYLFLSLVALPYLLLTAALVIRRLRVKQQTQASERLRRGELGLFLVVVLSCLLLFTTQIFTGRRDAAELAPYKTIVTSLREADVSVKEPEEVLGFQSLLEYSQLTKLDCDGVELVFHFHSGKLGIPRRFFNQAARDYRSFPMTESGDVSVWGPLETADGAAAALAVNRRDWTLVLELKGPEEDVETLVSLLTKRLVPQA